MTGPWTPKTDTTAAPANDRRAAFLKRGRSTTINILAIGVLVLGMLLAVGGAPVFAVATIAGFAVMGVGSAFIDIAEYTSEPTEKKAQYLLTAIGASVAGAALMGTGLVNVLAQVARDAEQPKTETATPPSAQTLTAAADAAFSRTTGMSISRDASQNPIAVSVRLPAR